MNTEQIRRIVNQKWFLPSATAVGGAIFGYTVGYMRTKSQYDKIEAQLAEFEARTVKLEEELSQATPRKQETWMLRESSGNESLIPKPRRVKVDLSPLDTAPDEEALKALKEDHPSSRGRIIEEPTKIGTVTDIRKNQNDNIEAAPVDERKGVVVNVFGDGAGDEWDYKTELEARTNEAPYIIHVDEFLSDEMGWDSQSMLTWYNKDQVLCDSHDTPIYNHAEVVGELRFGHGSNDPNVVYIRNPVLQAEYEVIRDEGSYEEIGLGEALQKQAEEDELRHSAVSRFRPE